MAVHNGILVAYYSLSGNTERMAKELAARLGADLVRIRERTERRGLLKYLRATLESLRERRAELADLQHQAADYRLILVGTPIWAGRMTPAVRSYLHTIRATGRDVAFFTTSGSTDAARIAPAVERILGREAVAFAGFDQSVLRDPAMLEQKLAGFVAALGGKSRTTSVTDATMHAHA